MNNPYDIAITLTPGITPRMIRLAIAKGYSPERLFQLTKEELYVIFGDNLRAIDAILTKQAFPRVEEELKFIEHYHIQALSYNDAAFPQRLNSSDCNDTPIVLYYLGKANLNATRSVAIVGTRKATDYGKSATEKIVQELPSEDTTIISGLAYGIDTAAHLASRKNNIPTIGVVGHGLDTIYPPQNRMLARNMIEQQGGIITEYPSKTPISPTNFPARNRIIAAMADATIVVEAAKKGGALITAQNALDYSRKLFAVPGRTNDTYSQGCNNLISSRKAQIYASTEDFFAEMNWEYNHTQNNFNKLTQEEQHILEILKCDTGLTKDEIVSKYNFESHKIDTLLLTLEFNDMIKCLPGGRYKTI